MVSIARKNLFGDPVRFLTTLVGITFSVALIACTIGIYLGFMQNAAFVIENTAAEIWVTSQNSENFNFSFPFPERKEFEVKATPGVAATEKILLSFSLMKLPDGGSTNVQVLGFNPDGGFFVPRMRQGSLADLQRGKVIILDETARGRLGEFRVGERREIYDTSVRVIGVAEGVKSFVEAPYVMMTYDNAQRVIPWVRDQTVFILVKVAEGFHPEAVKQALKRIRNVDVFLAEEYAFKTKMFWTRETGMGVGFAFVAVIGFGVGIVIVGQTIYAATLEHLQEFGTLKAIGADNRDVYRIVIEQALWIASAGYGCGYLLARAIQEVYVRRGLAMHLPQPFLAGMFFVTVLMCLVASCVSIRKAVKVDPMMVFRG